MSKPKTATFVVEGAGLREAIARLRPAAVTRSVSPGDQAVAVTFRQGAAGARLMLGATNGTVVVDVDGAWSWGQPPSAPSVTCAMPWRLLRMALRARRGGGVRLCWSWTGDEPGTVELSYDVEAGEAFWPVRVIMAAPATPVDPADWYIGTGVEGEPSERFTVPARAFRAALDRVAGYAARDDSRPVLTTVAIDDRDGVVRLAAADGFRLAVGRCAEMVRTHGESLHGGDVRLSPAEVAALRAAIDAKAEGELEIARWSKADVQMVSCEGWATWTRRVPGMFPKYEQLVPSDDVVEVRWEVYAGWLRQGLAALRDIAADGSGIVRWGVGNGVMSLSSRAEEVGEAELRVAWHGDPGRVALNIVYLQEVMAHFHGMVEVAFKSYSDPIRFRDPANPDEYVAVVMPMFIQWGDER